ncbi:maleylpyruvate isomerase family mycothiol-dependent enzyme [Corynebacterium alimapuense]|uniref:Maleylpyruvate isomerase n=1 Tax=Corynebacterium alimapuense TaxID=1576874 RepID=A0A3M8K7V4_9CORY|nr:maleylpyruvate isomerase family mycothiol-dependent enzyme [Corynebacterium alimapuense]RNE48558.1 maleylpyruvate isomerase [Corynebacterium alimapuense]
MSTSFHDLAIPERVALVREGSAHYTAQLMNIDDADFGRETLLSAWTAAELAAHVAYNAAALDNLMHWAHTGDKTPMYATPETRNQEIAYGATLPPVEIRQLHVQTLASLDQAWDETSDQAWSNEVITAQGMTVPAAMTVWMRTREVWIHAVDLNAGASFADIPEIILSTLVPEIAGKWRDSGLGEGLVLFNTDDDQLIEVSPGRQTTRVQGSLAGLAQWVTGRGSAGVHTSDRGEVPEPPRWL